MAAKISSLSCTLCLEVFRKPKLLPCFHTYCESCLKTLASQHGGKQFPCPNCRKVTQVPKPGGVGAFQTNFYIDSEELEEARKKFICKTHPSYEFVSFCISCDLPTCVECMLGEHRPHEIQTLANVATAFREQLSKDKLRLQQMVDSMKERVKTAEENRLIVGKMIEEAEVEIKTRCAQVVAEAEKHRDKELAVLATLRKQLDTTKEDKAVAASIREKCLELTKVQEEIQQALEKGGNLQIVTLAKEMKAGRESQQALQDLVPSDGTLGVTEGPMLQTRYTNIDKVKVSGIISSLVGFVKTKVVAQIQTGVHMFEKIQCQRNNIYSLCLFENGDVCVSYQQHDAPLQRFNKHGGLIDTTDTVTGKTGMLRLTRGVECLYLTNTQTKSVLCAKSSRLLVLEVDHLELGIVKKIDVKSKQTWITEWTPIFTINCTHCLAFDANDSETNFAVLEEEPQRDTNKRTVNIYQKPNPNPVCSFSFKSFQPSDICFYETSGREVLLIADETHGSIHVYSLEHGSSRTLASQSSVKMVPTALNIDTEGRLWIGCGDGRIFMCDHLVLD